MRYGRGIILRKILEQEEDLKMGLIGGDEKGGAGM
jgi:hypothetical protein